MNEQGMTALENNLCYEKFWGEFLKEIKKTSNICEKTAQDGNWLNKVEASKGSHISLQVQVKKKRVLCEIRIAFPEKEKNRTIRDFIFSKKGELDWKTRETKVHCMIESIKKNVNISSKKGLSEINKFFIDSAINMNNICKKYELKINELQN